MFEELINYLGDMLNHLVHAFLYPIQQFGNLVIGLISYIFNVFINFCNAFTGLFYTVSSSFSEFFTGLLPPAWVILLLLGLTIAVIQRLYFYLKDVSIAGFKV